MWEEDVIALLRRDCTRQQPQTRRKLNPPSLSFALPAVNLLPGSRAPAHVLSFINELWKTKWLNLLKILANCREIWLLPDSMGAWGWSTPSITMRRLPPNCPACFLHSHKPVLDAGEVTVLSPIQHHGFIAGEKCTCL